MKGIKGLREDFSGGFNQKEFRRIGEVVETGEVFMAGFRLPEGGFGEDGGGSRYDGSVGCHDAKRGWGSEMENLNTMAVTRQPAGKRSGQVGLATAGMGSGNKDSAGRHSASRARRGGLT